MIKLLLVCLMIFVFLFYHFAIPYLSPSCMECMVQKQMEELRSIKCQNDINQVIESLCIPFSNIPQNKNILIVEQLPNGTLKRKIDEDIHCYCGSIFYFFPRQD